MEAEDLADQLPESLREIADLVGLENTLTLVEHFGGIRVYIPHSADGHSLADLIGPEALRELCSIYGGEQIPVPRSLRLVRDAVIRARHHGTDGTDGESAPALAREFRLTERQIRNILNG